MNDKKAFYEIYLNLALKFAKKGDFEKADRVLKNMKEAQKDKTSADGDKLLNEVLKYVIGGILGVGITSIIVFAILVFGVVIDKMGL